MAAVALSPYAPALRLPVLPRIGLPGVNFGAIPGEAAQLGRIAGRQLKTGSRVAGRFLPLILAVEAGWYLQGALGGAGSWGSTQYIPAAGGWTLNKLCGPANRLRWNEGFSTCGVIGVVADKSGNPQTGPIKQFFLWWDHIPREQYIDGVHVIADPAAYYSAVINGAITQRTAPFVGAIPAPGLQDPWPIAALAPAAVPYGQPGRTPIPIPIRLWPGIKPNPNVPVSVQVQADYGVGPARSSPTQEAFPVTQGGGHVETFPGVPPIIEALRPSVPVVARPGYPIVWTSEGGVGAPVLAPHQYKPPGPGVKEVKPQSDPLVRYLLTKIINPATEYRELVDSLYWAIDPPGTGNYVNNREVKRYQRLQGHRVWWKDSAGKWHTRVAYNNITVVEKMNWIYQHLGDLQMNTAAANILKNEVGDAYGAALGGVAGRAGSKLGLGRQAAPSRASGVGSGGGSPLQPIYDLIDGTLGVPIKSDPEYYIRYGQKKPYDRSVRGGQGVTVRTLPTPSARNWAAFYGSLN